MEDNAREGREQKGKEWVFEVDPHSAMLASLRALKTVCLSSEIFSLAKFTFHVLP